MRVFITIFFLLGILKILLLFTIIKVDSKSKSNFSKNHNRMGRVEIAHIAPRVGHRCRWVIGKMGRTGGESNACEVYRSVLLFGVAEVTRKSTKKKKK